MFNTFHTACVPLVKDVVPWSRPILAARRAHNGAHEFAEFDVQLPEVLFVDFAMDKCKTSNWCYHGVKMS